MLLQWLVQCVVDLTRPGVGLGDWDGHDLGHTLRSCRETIY